MYWFAFHWFLSSSLQNQRPQPFKIKGFHKESHMSVMGIFAITCFLETPWILQNCTVKTKPYGKKSRSKSFKIMQLYYNQNAKQKLQQQRQAAQPGCRLLQGLLKMQKTNAVCWGWEHGSKVLSTD